MEKKILFFCCTYCILSLIVIKLMKTNGASDLFIMILLALDLAAVTIEVGGIGNGN